jgi:hypothetical protein
MPEGNARRASSPVFDRRFGPVGPQGLVRSPSGQPLLKSLEAQCA